MPSIFCLIENHDEVARFLVDVRHLLSVDGERLRRLRMSGGIRRAQHRRGGIYDSYVDFTTLDRITPAAALMLASEYDRADVLYGLGIGLKAVNLEQWKPEVRLTLQDLGFLSMLSVDAPHDYLAARGDVYIVPFISGTKVDGAVIEKLIRLLASIAEGGGIAGSERLLDRSRVYDGLGEAIQNVEDHAYPDRAPFEYRVPKKWWMTGAVEPAQKRFNLVIYDQGISIPGSLPNWSSF